MSDSPFVPGARVAIGDRYGEGTAEGFVDKLYKSGNFTLRGSRQQWRSWKTTYDGQPRWSAVETGGGYYRRRLDIWDASTDKEIKDRLERHKTKLRWRDLRAKVDNVQHPTPAFCDALEAALAVLRSPQEAEGAKHD